MKVLKYALIFLAGGGIGFGAATAVFTIKAKKVKEEHEKELADIDAYYAKRIEDLTWEDDDEKDEEEEESYQEVPEKAAGPAEKRGGPFKTPYWSNYPNAKAQDPAESESPREEEIPIHVKQLPKVIKNSDYGQDGYSTRVLYYYTADDALVPEDSTYEDIIDTDEVKDMICNALDKYGFRENGQRDICVRNFDRKCDYKIVKQFGSLSEDYGG